MKVVAFIVLTLIGIGISWVFTKCLLHITAYSNLGTFAFISIIFFTFLSILIFVLTKIILRYGNPSLFSLWIFGNSIMKIIFGAAFFICYLRSNRYLGKNIFVFFALNYLIFTIVEIMFLSKEIRNQKS